MSNKPRKSHVPKATTQRGHDAGSERVRYSPEYRGNAGNFRRAVCFDATTDGYLGITSLEGGVVIDRVLLTPRQVQALLQFLGAAA